MPLDSLNLFSVGHLLLDICLTIKKSLVSLLLASDYHFARDSVWVRYRVMSLILSALGITWCRPVQALCMLPWSLWVPMHVTDWFKGLCPLGVFCPHLALTLLLLSLLQGFLSPGVGSGGCVFQGLLLCILPACRSVFVPICSRRRLHWLWMSKAVVIFVFLGLG